ncbi:serine/threonine-protein kinase [Streptomyces sp. NPDC052095]|uniref:serine/threonine-protein kinase n=1 Tax=unclassified Streptomyces TaxID=2593676 RepID=UPI00344DAD75
MSDRFKTLADGDPKSVGGYAIRARLGAGGMGRVYLAFTPGGRALAIKVVRPDFAEDDEFRRRFRKEVEASQRVQGLYTAPVVDANAEAPLPWMATAYVPGPSLHQAVIEHGPLPLPAVFRLLAGVAEGLGAIHACKLIHRDLKPANILLADDGPRVIDFGIAHAVDGTALTRTRASVGTPAFMAPEQVRGRAVSPATDVFALGNVAVFAATGRTVFGAGDPDALFYRIINEDPDLDSCPPELRVIIERCLAKEPGQRPSVAEIMDYARRQTQGATMGFAGSWLPEPVAASLVRYGTAKYTVPAKTKPAKAAKAKLTEAAKQVEAKVSAKRPKPPAKDERERLNPRRPAAELPTASAFQAAKPFEESWAGNEGPQAEHDKSEARSRAWFFGILSGVSAASCMFIGLAREDNAVAFYTLAGLAIAGAALTEKTYDGSSERRWLRKSMHPRTLRIDPDGVSASDSDGSQLIPWASIAQIAVRPVDKLVADHRLIALHLQLREPKDGTSTVLYRPAGWPLHTALPDIYRGPKSPKQGDWIPVCVLGPMSDPRRLDLKNTVMAYTQHPLETPKDW